MLDIVVVRANGEEGGGRAKKGGSRGWAPCGRREFGVASGLG